MNEYYLGFTGEQLDDAVNKVRSGYILPEGTINIGENKTFNVTDFAQAVVNVPIPENYINIDELISHCTKTANGNYSKTSDTTLNNISITVGFRPKVFVLTNLSGIISNSTSNTKNHLLTSAFVYDDDNNMQLQFSSYLYLNSGNYMGSRSASDANVLAPTTNGVKGGSGTIVVARGNVTYQWYAWG